MGFFCCCFFPLVHNELSARRQPLGATSMTEPLVQNNSADCKCRNKLVMSCSRKKAWWIRNNALNLWHHSYTPALEITQSLLFLKVLTGFSHSSGFDMLLHWWIILVCYKLDELFCVCSALLHSRPKPNQPLCLVLFVMPFTSPATVCWLHFALRHSVVTTARQPQVVG